MSEELFDVVFFGILQPGKDKETVIQNMAAVFKTDAAKLAPYFAGGRKVIKGKINAQTAEKYRGALENVGMVIKIEASASSPATTAETTGNSQPADTGSSETPDNKAEEGSAIDTSGISVAPVGADVIENPVEPPPAKIDDISSITMAEPGVDVIENPVRPAPQEIGDISDLTVAEPGSDVLENPPQVEPQKIDDISDLSLAEPGVDIIENPKPREKAKIPDTSELSLD